MIPEEALLSSLNHSQLVWTGQSWFDPMEMQSSRLSTTMLVPPRTTHKPRATAALMVPSRSSSAIKGHQHLEPLRLFPRRATGIASPLKSEPAVSSDLG